MREAVIDALIWWVGALVWLGVLAALTAVLAGFVLWTATRMARNLMEFVRFATARYWVTRMESEGLTIMQKEYRSMVERQKPKRVRDFMQLNSDKEERQRAARPQGEK